MLYSMYEIMPNNKAYIENITIQYDDMGRPIMVGYGEEDDIY